MAQESQFVLGGGDCRDPTNPDKDAPWKALPGSDLP
jgi:hypothetical protein